MNFRMLGLVVMEIYGGGRGVSGGVVDLYGQCVYNVDFMAGVTLGGGIVRTMDVRN